MDYSIPAGATAFQSTLPVGGATAKAILPGGRFRISIHAPRGGSDQPFGTNSIHDLLFQSTLPVGGATKLHAQRHSLSIFQSTLPVGGATWG